MGFQTTNLPIGGGRRNNITSPKYNNREIEHSYCSFFRVGLHFQGLPFRVGLWSSVFVFGVVVFNTTIQIGVELTSYSARKLKQFPRIACLLKVYLFVELKTFYEKKRPPQMANVSVGMHRQVYNKINLNHAFNSVFPFIFTFSLF